LYDNENLKNKIEKEFGISLSNLEIVVGVFCDDNKRFIPLQESGIPFGLECVEFPYEIKENSYVERTYYLTLRNAYLKYLKVIKK
jgi:hypothetical protein